MKKKLNISVRRLVDHFLCSGDLESKFMGISLSVEAIRAHQKIQKSRPVEYTPEVSVSNKYEVDNFEIEIRGRIDGVYHYPDRIIIDEIKTTTKSIQSFKEKESRLHWAQVKCYAYIYATQNNLDKIEAQLTYFQLQTDEIKIFLKKFTVDELQEYFQWMISGYLEWAEKTSEWCMIRDESILSLEFPFPEYRPGQRDMAVKVYLAVKNKAQLIVQAPTGIGKTIAVIFPALKALAESHTSKIFYLTARTTGRTVAEETLDQLRNKGLKIKSVTLTAKKKICFNPESTCSPDECEFAKGYFDRINEAVKEIFEHDSFTRLMIEEKARKYMVCPFEFSLDLSLEADCVICDFNYAFDPKAYLRRFFLEGNGEYTFLIDEAHNLVDRAREMFSAELRKQTFLEHRRPLKEDLPQIFKSMGKINSCLLNLRKRCEKAGRSLAEKEQPEDLYPLLRNFLKNAEQWLSRNVQTAYRKNILDLYFDVAAFIKVSEKYDESYATCFESYGRDLRLKLFCVDPSVNLKQCLERCVSAIFFSATLTPLQYFKKLLGCEDTADELILPSPFPRENLCILLMDRISTLYRQREKTKTEVARAIISLIKAKKGNYLLFFPSYKYMEMVYEIVDESCPEINAILQTSGMPEHEREIFLKKFASENDETLVGFAVMGGVFGEGIDLVGDRLTGAVIVGVGLPGISPERDLIKDYFNRAKVSGFEYAYTYPGINRVLQAAGRVIRTEKDRGMIFLIDERFSTHRYRSLLPYEWRPIRMQNEGHLNKVLKQFWHV